MKKSKILMGVYGLIVLLLLGGCVYFYNESTKPAFKVTIGTPVGEEAVQFGDSIKDKKVVNDITLALIGTDKIDKPQITERLPDAHIRLDDFNMGVSWLWAKVWIDGNDVILSRGNETDENGVRYEKITGASGETIIKYISEYK